MTEAPASEARRRASTGAWYRSAVECPQAAVTRLHGGRPASLQQLAADFRRGDLFETLDLE